MDLDFGFSVPGENPYGLVGRPILLFEGYKEWNGSEQAEQLREAAHTTSDFATYLSGVIRKRFMDVYGSRTTDWSRYAMKQSLADFREDTLVGLTEFSDLLEVEEENEYKYGTVGEMEGPAVQLRTFGRLLQVSRKLLINDDLGRLSRLPAAMARAAARTLEQDVLDVLVNNATAYDGVAMFHASHGNLGSTALSESALQARILALLAQTNQNGDPLDIDMASIELIVPTGLMFTARRIINSAIVEQTSAGVGTANVMKDAVRLHVEPKFTDQTDWYLQSRIVGSDMAPVIVGFLNGKETPDVLQKTTVQQLGGGAFDPYALEVDSIDFKVRHDWGVSAGEWRLVDKSVVAG